MRWYLMPGRFFSTVAALWLVVSVAHAELELTDAWVRAVPPVSTTTAAYFTLKNNGTEPVVLAGASAAFAGAAELHDMSMHEGRRRMRRVEALPLAAGESVTFGSGGLHVMLFRLSKVPVQGETVELCLTFAERAPLCAPFAVRLE